MVDPTPPVAGRASRALGWSFANTMVSRLGTLVVGIALARVLGPSEFGVFAIAMVALLAILSFNELGVSLAIVRWPTDPRIIAPTVNTIAVGMSAVLTAVMVAVAPAVSTALGDVRAAPVVQVLAVSILINGLVATPAALLQREFMSRQRMVADQLNSWLGAGVSLVLALLGWGAMSLAAGRIVGSLAAAVVFFRWSPAPYRFGWDRTVARQLFSFGLPLAASSVVVFASGYADQVVVGATLGATALGYYALAFNLSSWPVSVFSQPLRQVAPAAFARLQHDPERMRRNFVSAAAVLSGVALPACLAIAGAATPVVRFVYGSPWLPAAAVLAWLAAQAALRIWFELTYDYLVVLGRSRGLLAIQLCWFAAGVPAMLVGAHYAGVAGVAAAQFLVALTVVLGMYGWQLGRSGLRLRTLLRPLALPVASGAVAGGLAYGIAQLGLGAFVASLLAGLVSCLVIGLLLLHHRPELTRLRSVEVEA
ncbi:MAG: oligosaccharide flippase family protein [Actinobacteria bacterium]|nr:oligosaccharide flippase family protein [Actinomycetota bacterium]